MDKLAPLSARAKQNPGVATFRYAGVKVAGTGGEREPCASGNSQIAPEGGAKCGALLSGSTMAHDEALREVIDAWPELPAALQRGILAIVRAGRNRREERCAR